MKIPLRLLTFFFAASLGWAQPFGLSNRVANTTLRMPLTPTPTINYRIPPDNPFIGVTNFNGSAVNSNNVRTEFYAVGLRNPWRWSFDPVTGWLWLADVGQDQREEIDIIRKGGNYGWAYREGTIAGPKTPPANFTHINPIYDYGRTDGNSVSGGVVYRGSGISALYGAYVFADYGSGRIWQMRYEVNGSTTNFVPPVQIATDAGISCFGVDPSNGDVLLGNVNNGRIRRLVSVGSTYALSNAFGDSLTFTAPVAIVTPPGESNRVFIVEQSGRIAVVTNLASPNRTVFMDLTSRVRFSGEQGLLGLAFHPGYLTNRYFYAFYVGNTNGNQTTDSSTRHEILSRFEISPTDPNAGLPNSELMLIRQQDEASNHNAGDIHFGSDGYLYVSLGDEGGGNDQFNNSQTITKDFFSGIIRIDVDNRPGSLMPNAHPSNTIGPSQFIPPATLADAGIFSDTAALTPNPGIIPYDVNTPYWTDGAIKTRWFSLPDLASRIVFRGTQAWTFPSGMVWVQHFDLEMTNGVPGSRQRIETRVLVRDASTGHYGVTYRWNDPTNAVLVAAEGESQTFTIYDNGVSRAQTWRYPSRADCLACHSATPGRALGFTTAQLNRDFNYAAYTGVVDNQLRALANAGYFSAPVSNIHSLPLMARIDDSSFGVQYRARSYLMANCAHCHYPTTTNGNFNARIYQPLSTEGIIDGTLRNILGDPANRVIRRGSVANSMIHTRLASTTGTRMPPLDTQLVDQQAVDVFRDWIQELANYSTFPEWQIANFGSTNAPNALATADPDGDGARNQLEYYTGTNPNDPLDAWGIGIQRGQGQVSITYTQTPNYGFEVQWTTNILNPAFWRLLNTPENRPNFSGQTQLRTVPDAIEPVRMKNYRVRVFEP
ncbi:MAG TPA: PQQ-dependent sugar dehydrogenase [Verrucomicrobiae bacterium]|nr:PQQ-dependent sugar dehydrogenase [Verrucomicrobiae bacterium]